MWELAFSRCGSGRYPTPIVLSGLKPLAGHRGTCLQRPSNLLFERPLAHRLQGGSRYTAIGHQSVDHLLCITVGQQLAAVDHDIFRGKLRDIIRRSEEHTSELQSLMRISYAVFCLKKKNKHEKQI